MDRRNNWLRFAKWLFSAIQPPPLFDETNPISGRPKPSHHRLGPSRRFSACRVKSVCTT